MIAAIMMCIAAITATIKSLFEKCKPSPTSLAEVIAYPELEAVQGFFDPIFGSTGDAELDRLLAELGCLMVEPDPYPPSAKSDCELFDYNPETGNLIYLGTFDANMFFREAA